MADLARCCGAWVRVVVRAPEGSEGLRTCEVFDCLNALGDPSPSSRGSSYSRRCRLLGEVPSPVPSPAVPRGRERGMRGMRAPLPLAGRFPGGPSPSPSARAGVNCLVPLPAAGLPSQHRSSRNRGSWFSALCHKSKGKKKKEKEGRESIPSSRLWLTLADQIRWFLLGQAGGGSKGGGGREVHRCSSVAGVRCGPSRGVFHPSSLPPSRCSLLPLGALSNLAAFVAGWKKHRSRHSLWDLT